MPEYNPQDLRRSGIKLLLRALSTLAALVALGGCPPPSLSTPTPDQPKVVSGFLMGHRVCGSLATTFKTFTFDCASSPLPTNDNTGWQLTPLQFTPAGGRTEFNTGVNLTVTTPSLTNLSIALERDGASSLPFTQIPAGGPDPLPLGGATRQVKVGATDNGTVKTWTLRFIVGTCEESAAIDIVDTDGTRNSNALVVYLLRDPAETTDCAGSGPPVTIGGSGTSGASTPPTIASVSPAAAYREGTVTVTGTNFSTSCGNDQVTIGGVTAAATDCSATSLKFVVPNASPSGPMTPIIVTVGTQHSSAFNIIVNPTRVVAAGGPNSAQVGVVDFSDPTTNPKVKVFNAGFVGGIVVDCSGRHLVVGDATQGSTGQVLVFDISDPANPAQRARLPTNFTQLGAIKFDGTRILAGDANGFQVALINFANPNSLSLITKFQTHESAITSVGLSGSFGLVSGTFASTVDVLPNIPLNPAAGTTLTAQLFNPNIGGVTSDLSGTLAALGSKGNGTVKLFDVSQSLSNAKGSAATSLGSIDSISISGTTVAVGSNNNSSAFLINFAPSPAQLSAPIVPMLSGATVNFNGQQLVIGGVNNSNVSLFNVSIDQTTNKPVASLVKSVNLSTSAGGVNSIGTVCIATF